MNCRNVNFIIKYGNNNNTKRAFKNKKLYSNYLNKFLKYTIEYLIIIIEGLSNNIIKLISIHIIIHLVIKYKNNH